MVKAHWSSMVRVEEEIDYYGGLYALQKQANLDVHIGGRTALSLQGKAQYLELSTSKAILFGTKGVKLPLWFCNYDWEIEIEYFATSILPSDLGLVDIQIPVIITGKWLLSKISNRVKK